MAGGQWPAGGRMGIAGGTRFDHFEVIAPLGAGGMGEVYLARDTRLDRNLAIKLLPFESTRDAERVRRFVQEAKAASSLNHPNIITIYEIGETQGTYYIASELIEGETLRHRLKDTRPSLSETLNIVVQMLSAVAMAHAAGIVHRDLKPENVMVRPDGLVKVLDFGLAKLTVLSTNSVDSEADTIFGARTAPGVILGTFRYMSPEQARGLAVDGRSDIFSIGVILYELVTGRAPFKGETVSDVIAALLTAEPPLIAELCPDTPAELQRIIRKTLRKDKESRYQSAKDLLADLKVFQQDQELSAKLGYYTGKEKMLHAGEPVSSETTPRKFQLRHALMMLPVALLAIFVVWWFVTGRHSKTKIISPSSLKTVEVVSWRSVPGEVYSAGSLSPDGKMIAFTSTRAGARNIWVKQTASGEAVQITKDDFGIDHPIWSPSGDEIAFFSTRGNQPGIWKTPALGGSPTLVTTLQDGGARPVFWSRDTTAIYFESNHNLFAFDIKTGRASQVSDLASAKVKANTMSISHDEKHLAYITSGQDGRGSVWVAPLRGGPPVQVAANAGDARNTTWHPDGKMVLYSSNVDGVFQIFVTHTDERKPAQITTGETNSFVLDVSSDGGKVLYGSSKEDSDVWGVNAASGEESALTSEIGSELWPDVSPDNKMIAYQAVRGLSQGDKIFNCSILTRSTESEGQQIELTADGFLPKWSPDGNHLAFMRVAGNAFSIWRIGATGGEEKRLATGGLSSVEFSLFPYNRVQTSYFSWSPDSSRIVYRSNRSGHSNLWVVAYDGSSDFQLTNNSDTNQILHCPLWSSDGKLIAYSSKPNKAVDGKLAYTVWIIDTETKNVKSIFQSDSFLRLIGWSQMDKELIIATFKGRSVGGKPTDAGLAAVSVDNGQQRSIAALQFAYLYNIHLSANRRTIAYVSNKDGKDNAWVVSVNGGKARKLTANSDPRLYFSSLSWSPDGRAIYLGKQYRHSLLSMLTNLK